MKAWRVSARFSTCVMLTLLVTVIWGCGSRESNVEAREGQTESDRLRDEAVASSADWGIRPPWEQPDDALVATVDNEQIVKGDVMEWALLLLSRQGIDPDSDEGRKWLNENVTNITDTLITYRILRQEAEENTPIPTDEEIDKEIDIIQKRFKDRQALEDYLAKHKLSIADYRQILKMDIQFKRFVSDRSLTFAGPEPTDEMVKQYYDKHKQKFNIPAAVKYREIYFHAGDPATEEEWVDAKKRADNVYNLITNGSDFSQLARNHSQSASRDNGGVMPYVLRKDVTDQNLAGALFTLIKDQISQPIRMGHGYIIIQILDTKPPQLAKLGPELAPIIRKSIQDDRMKSGFKNWLEKERKKRLIVVSGNVINDPYQEGDGDQ